MFTTHQHTLLQHANLELMHCTEMAFFQIIHDKQPQSLTLEALVECLTICNALYRGGEPLMSDADYDFVFSAELKKRDPQHPFLLHVEPEPVTNSKTIALPEKMLSTDKAYTHDEIERWVARVEKSALSLNKPLESLQFRVTPKLDGYAAYDDGKKLYTRGDGVKGTDITRAFDRGLLVATQGERGLGAGEVVISKRYFNQHLAADFDNSRNFQASIIKEKSLSPHAEQAIKAGAAVFFPFVLLPDWIGDVKTLLADFDGIIKSIWHQTDYDVDGVVLEVTDTELKQAMGATRHHHRWQIAYKENLATAEVKVLSVTPQTSRTGRITPVAELEPVRLSGALIRRATVHHYKMVKEKGIGIGAVVELSRSGEVIPKIEQVLQPASPQIPENCPSCEGALIWESDFLICTNHVSCPAQIANTMAYFFKTLANNDGFGQATIQKLYDNEVYQIPHVYALTSEDFKRFGFGDKQSENLVNELRRSRIETIEDWRFLAAFGLLRLGLGNCEKLLEQHPLMSLFTLTETDIIAIEGFAEKTAAIIVKELVQITPLFKAIYQLGFALNKTEIITLNPLKATIVTNKQLVFTGKMQQGSRDAMKKQAKALGAKIGNRVTGKTDWLVVGEKVGATKITHAKKHNVRIVTEKEYLELIDC
ncbi:MAG: DNA ligase [Methylococcales bacterium]|nr:DNA ligase [Methylococcales bacterium]MCK5925570.1 DNA ligase [Methylococcales bacterium]